MDPTLQWVLGGVFTAALAILMAFVKYLFSTIKSHRDETHERIDKVESATKEKVEKLQIEVESKRIETRDHLLELINTKFDFITDSIRDLKDRIS